MPGAGPSATAFSSGESSSSRWNRGFLAVTVELLERRRGREPMDTKAPGPLSSENAERVRRWPGREGGERVAVVVEDDEEEGRGDEGSA